MLPTQTFMAHSIASLVSFLRVLRNFQDFTKKVLKVCQFLGASIEFWKRNQIYDGTMIYLFILIYGENKCSLSTELFNFDKTVFYATRGNNFFWRVWSLLHEPKARVGITQVKKYFSWISYMRLKVRFILDQLLSILRHVKYLFIYATSYEMGLCSHSYCFTWQFHF